MDITNILNRHTKSDIAVFLIRLLVGIIFLSEGFQKFIYPAALGPGRFAVIGFPAFTFWAYFVAVVEVVCGAMVVVGFHTRLASTFLLIDITVAILITKLPILFGSGFGPFEVHQLSRYGFWAMMHEARTDFSMFTGTIFLLMKGGGKWSWDLRFRTGQPTS